MGLQASFHAPGGGADFLGMRKGRSGATEIVYDDGVTRRMVWRVATDDPSEARISEALRVAERMRLAVASGNLQADGELLRYTASFGVALFYDAQGDVAELLKRADLAMYQAKAAGRNTLRFFNPQMQAEVSARASLESDLRQSLDQHDFILHYQPQVDAHGQLVGAEALVRWLHPLRGLVPPGEFIPLAESTGLILPLGRLILRAACQQLVAWANDPQLAHLTLAVNVSARQFHHPDFIEDVFAALAESGAKPERLELELTESQLVEDVETLIDKMSQLKARGVHLALDDFGTGYSSLNYLKRLPLDQLKIDQSFVRDLLVQPSDAAIVRTILALGANLDLAVTAEGVETIEQREALLAMGCQKFQGYLFARPGPAQLLEQWPTLNSRDITA